MKNPEWQKAEDERLAAEEKYSDFMASAEATTLRAEKPIAFRKRVEALNAEIEAANQKVRGLREELPEDEG